MKNLLRNLKEDFLIMIKNNIVYIKFLQYYANVICDVLILSMGYEYRFKFWMFIGKSLNKWCVDREIYLK